MRFPTSRRILLVVALVVAAVACSDDGPSASSTTASPTSSTSLPPAANDASLQPRLVKAADLPAGFATSPSVDDTVTTFCVGEDAAAGLQASARALVAYTRTPPGASVVHLVFRFRDGDATRFVTRATEILGRCSNVPDATGLAFAYEPAGAELEAVLAGTEGHVASYGTSAGSGVLAINIAVFRRGDIGELVAVLTKDEGRDVTDGLARAAFTAAVARMVTG